MLEFVPLRRVDRSMESMRKRAFVTGLALLWLASGCTEHRTKLAVEAERDGNRVRSFHIWRSLARQGDGQAKYKVGLQYMTGLGVHRSEHRAIHWFRKAALDDVPEAKDKLAQMYLNGRGNPEEDPNAERWLRESIETGIAESQYKLAIMYLDGTVVEKSTDETLAWMRLAAENWGQRNQGIDQRLYNDHLLITMAEIGLAEAQIGLGKRYASGNGVPRNRAEAAKWYFLAAEQGHARAQLTLGWAYRQGEGVTKDFDEAARWFSKAAGQGLPEAEYQLGTLFRRGLGMPQDNLMAHVWFNLAAGHGLVKARAKRREVQADLSPAELVWAEALALERSLALLTGD